MQRTGHRCLLQSCCLLQLSVLTGFPKSGAFIIPILRI
jgi:hypothetical protein